MMRRLWTHIRLPLAVVFFLVMALAFARLFSGPEDTWIQNERGEWIMHGHPAGPPPAVSGKTPHVNLLVPLSFLAVFVFPLFLLGIHKPHNRLTLDTASRDIKFLGYVSTSLVLFGILICVGLALELARAEEGVPGLPEFLFIGGIGGFGGLCIVIGCLLFVLKRTINDHYQLEKTYREILETLERMQ